MKAGCQWSSRPRSSSALASCRQRADEPLARRDELERPVALLVELDRVLDRLRLAERARPPSRSSSTIAVRACFAALPGEPAIAAFAASGRATPSPARRTSGDRAGRRADHDARRAGPARATTHVGRVAEGADHRMPVPFSGSTSSSAKIGTGDAEERRQRASAEERL